jgi:hypothetical protein
VWGEALSRTDAQLEPELLRWVQDAAAAHNASLACWLQHALQQVNPDEFPPSWRAGETTVRSHGSGYYHRKFRLRLDEVTSGRLEALAQTFNRPAAEVIRQLIMQARPEDFPTHWRRSTDGHHA